MSNQKTADEWKQAAANANAELQSVSAKIDAAEANISKIQAQQTEIMQQRNALSREGVGMNDPRAAALRVEYFKLDDQVAQQKSLVGDLVSKETILEIAVNNAKTQANQAETGTAGTSVNTPPVTDVPVQPVNQELANYQKTIADRELNAYNVDTNIPLVPVEVQAQKVVNVNIIPSTPEEIAASDLEVYKNNAVSVEERNRIEIAASDLEVYPNAVAAEEDAGLFDQQQAILKAQKEQKSRDFDAAMGAAGATSETNAYLNNFIKNNPAPATPDNSAANTDWRVRLSLAPSADYLYNIAETTDILYPLKNTKGVIFPYTPQIATGYKANYEPSDLTHSNYKLFFYKNSSVDDISITAEFTAQDTLEANYLLAVIHFFKSATKMFYGQDKDPRAGTPPPLLYLTGFGAYQFNNHPLALTSFTYNLPSDVDYIRAGGTNTWAGISIESAGTKSNKSTSPLDRLKAAFGNKIGTGGVPADPVFKNLETKEATYVPTKIQIQLALIPIVSRDAVSKEFSLKDYATGSLLLGNKRKNGGMW